MIWRMKRRRLYICLHVLNYFSTLTQLIGTLIWKVVKFLLSILFLSVELAGISLALNLFLEKMSILYGQLARQNA